MEDAINNAMLALDEKPNYIAYCPICEGLVSVSNENEEFIYVDCFNSVCPMGTYILRRDRMVKESPYVSKELAEEIKKLSEIGEPINNE